MKKRTISTILVALLALSACAGCGSGTSISSSSDVSSNTSLSESSVVSEVSVESSKTESSKQESSEESSKVENSKEVSILEVSDSILSNKANSIVRFIETGDGYDGKKELKYVLTDVNTSNEETVLTYKSDNNILTISFDTATRELLLTRMDVNDDKDTVAIMMTRVLCINEFGFSSNDIQKITKSMNNSIEVNGYTVKTSFSKSGSNINGFLKITKSNEPSKSETSKEESFKTESSKEESSKTVTLSSYQSILDEYSEKIKSATPKLVSEYNKEAANYIGDIDKLAEISVEKTSKLADIVTEGTEKMAQVMLDTNDSYSNYEKWAKKLQDVYMNEAGKISDAYIKTAMQ